ncbi:MAG TPA: hypothetical protein VJU87_06735 [Gemmatimonadaceae bacterium]|nr:hypothetical protein [Gemmatimonadaceae bacterium]
MTRRPEHFPGDPQLARALRLLYPEPEPDRAAALERRILQRAAPVLARRRQSLAWWEYPASWAGMLLPLGVATALAAAACLFWITLSDADHAPPAAVSERVALLQAVTSRVAAPSLVELALSPSERPVLPARDSGQ